MRAPYLGYAIASVCGGMLVALVLLAVGAFHGSQTRTVELEPSYGSANPQPSGAGGAVSLNYVFHRDGPGVVLVRARGGVRRGSRVVPAGPVRTASGFLVAPHGYLLTSYHAVAAVAAAGGMIAIQFDDGVVRPAQFVRGDPADDLALIKVSVAGILPIVAPLPLGDSRSIAAGDTVIALGNPFGLGRTIASGVISGLQPQVVTRGGITIDDVFQTDIAPTATSPGGPLLDDSGNVIAMVANVDGIPFAIPIDAAKPLINGAVETH